MRFRDGLSLLREREGECPVQVEFQQSNAAEAACVQRFPVLLCKQRLFCHGKLPLQGPQSASEFFTFLFFLGIIAREMHIDPTTRQLWSGSAKTSHFVSSDQHMTNASAIFQVFEMIELILQSTATPSLSKVM